MSDDIQFGEVEQAEPEVALRPDQDAHFVTAEIGELRPGELPIFVDLDVMRDMEAHATSNTRVELGGVMLGKQLLDNDGVPYVVITDSLRAEHYEATKGSFKFTHDTWSRITRQRAEFHPDLEMVGWYHTHPGWSVFLSGMDLFICNNFFNRPLDVALVIDPCEQDRGWFQWTGDDPPATHRTGGFTLMTGRYRADELDYFARIYNKEPDMNFDPRYSSAQSGSTSVQLMDSRKSTMELAVIGLLAMQFLLMFFFAWKTLVPSGPSEEVVKLEKQIEELEISKQQSVRERIYGDALQSVATLKTGDRNFANLLTQAQESELKSRSNLEAQYAYNRELVAKQESLNRRLTSTESKRENLAKQLAKSRDKEKKTAASLKDLKAIIDDDGVVTRTDWWLIGGVALLSLGLGLGAGYIFGGRKEDFEKFDDYPPRNKSDGLSMAPKMESQDAREQDTPLKPATDSEIQIEGGSMVISDEPES